MKKDYLIDFQKEIDISVHTCRKAIDRWLQDQDLSLSENKKQKLSLLLVHYMGEYNALTEEHVINLLGNLGGGHFDFDDMDSVEIEIQRLLGHSRESRKEKDRLFYHKAVLLGLLIFAVMTLAIFTITFTPRPEMPSHPVSEAQIQELYRLADSVMQLRSDLGRPYYSREETIRIIGSPLGIYKAGDMTITQYERIKGLLQNFKIELLKQKIPHNHAADKKTVNDVKPARNTVSAAENPN